MTEPKDLADLYRQAQCDLANPRGALLRWVFWHAKAVAKLEVARAVLKRFEQRDWELCARASAYMPETTQYQGIMAQRPAADIPRAESLVTDCAAFVHAAAGVIEMLRPLDNGHTRTAAHVAPGSRQAPDQRTADKGAPAGQADRRQAPAPPGGSNSRGPVAVASMSKARPPGSVAQSGPPRRG
jgi:hypothetical protein